MHIVSDTSPLLNLAIIGKLSLLKDQFGTILIPPIESLEEVLQDLHEMAGFYIGSELFVEVIKART